MKNALTDLFLLAILVCVMLIMACIAAFAVYGTWVFFVGLLK